MALPADLTFDSQPDPSDKNYTLFTIQPLQVGTPYQFQFQWIFEDPQLNELVGDNWSNTFEYTSKTAERPSNITNLAASWTGEQGDDLTITFDHDTTLNNGINNNTTVNNYLIKLKHIGPNAPAISETQSFYFNTFDKSKTQKIYPFTRDLNQLWFLFADQLEITVIAQDTFNNIESDPVTIQSPMYTGGLLPQTITVVPIKGGYKVTYIDDPKMLFVEVWENLTSDNPDIGWYRVVTRTTGNPIDVYVLTTQSRSVKIRVYNRNNKYVESNVVDNVIPGSLDPTDEIPPGVPTVSIVSTTSNTITVNIINADNSTKAHRLRFKENGATLYQTDIVPYTGSTTPYTFGDLKPNTTYNISAASYDNLNNLSAYSAPDINATTESLIANPPTAVTLTASASGVLGSWTAPAVQPARVDKYKIELWKDEAVDTLVTTEFTFSTNVSFGGLTAGSYYIKVQTQDIYGTLSTAAQSSTVSVTGVNPTDGLVPSSSPAAVVNPLYGALEVKWTAITNADPVTYEVHLSTTNNFTPDTSTLALQVTGTFAIIKTLPGTNTQLPYFVTGTTTPQTYYVKIRAKDADGPAASYGTQGSSTTSQIDNGDIAANAIRANVIRAGEITADQINSGALLANKIITVGARAAVVTAASVSGGNITYTTSAAHGFAVGTLVSVTGMTTNAFNITDYAIQTVTTVSPHQFTVVVGTSGATGSLTNQAGVASATATNSIKIDATGTGASSSPFKLYSGTGTYSNNATAFYLDTNGQFSLKDKLYFDGTTLTVNGTIQAQTGFFGGAITVDGNGGSMKIGPLAGGIGNDGIYINTNNYWYKNGNIKIGGASNNVTWNGTTLSVTGEINAASGTITGNLTMTGGGSVIARTVANSNNRVNLSYAGLFAYDGNGLETTKIISDAAAGAPTFYTTRASIGGFSIDSTTISTPGLSINSSNAAGGTQILSNNGSYYIGIKPSGTLSSVVLWAGASSDGTGTPNFSVTAEGKLTAREATVFGTVTAGTGLTLVRIGKDVDGVTGSGNHGLYVAGQGTGDYIYGNGNFRLGNGTLLNNSTGLTIGGATTIKGGEITIESIGTVETDSNGFAGDSTLGLNDDNKLTKQRRFIFNGTNNVPADPTNWNQGVYFNKNQGTWTNNSGTVTNLVVKTGDIVMIY